MNATRTMLYRIKKREMEKRRDGFFGVSPAFVSFLVGPLVVKKQHHFDLAAASTARATAEKSSSPSPAASAFS